MATGLLALLDDMTVLLDDIGAMSKIAAKKTAGIVGDDLAVNAEQVTGVKPQREIPVVWAVAKGSFINKLILVPAALAISAVASWLITPLLMIGGVFLCFEGAEKIAHKLFQTKEEQQHEHNALVTAALVSEEALMAFENDKIKGAIRTDFILSAEIVAITLGAVAGKPFMTQLGTLSLIAIGMTFIVYGVVAGIIKLDDLGYWLEKRASGAMRTLGRGILAFAPKLMLTLSVVGTAAMFMVGGGILVHGIPALHHLNEAFGAMIGMPGIGSVLFGLIVGFVTGVIAAVIWHFAGTHIVRMLAPVGRVFARKKGA